MCCLGRVPAATFLLLVTWSAEAKPGNEWESLKTGLQAWETFKFDTGFTYEVIVDGRSVFRYPGELAFEDAAVNVSTESDFEIKTTGAKNDGELVKRVTQPHVAAILKSKDPGLTQGPNSVSREDLLVRSGGLTLLDLTKAAGTSNSDVVNSDAWQVLRDGIDAWASLEFDIDFTVNVGDKSGTLFTYTKGKTGMHTRLPGASLSKWPAALMISGLVADGTLSYDDKANKHLKWWTTDPNDPRSLITLRHLLTFQSGYMEDASVACARNPNADYLECAHDLYESSKLVAAPGTSWAYISCHLQFAGAMAVAATGLRPDQLFQKYLYEPLGMTETTWTPLRNPQMATGITTTGSDFEKMMHKMLTYDFLGKEILDEMERDWSAPPVTPCGDGWFGHYGMGHWFDCIGYAAGQKAGASAALPKFCLDEAIPAGPGAYAYFPLIDRKRGYYFQIVLAEDSNCRSEIPEYLRVIAKPVVDAIIEDTPLDNDHLLSRMGGLLVREIADIYNYLPPRCQPGEVTWAPFAQRMSESLVI